MPLLKVCATCNKDYRVPPARAASRYCSKPCANEGSRTLEVRKTTCARCEKEFNAKQDHGVWPKYCSKTCFHAEHVRPEPKECRSCGGVFMAGRARTGLSEDGRRIYCGAKCAHEGARKGDSRSCLHCGAEFYLSPSRVAGRPDESCCSPSCQQAHYVGQLAPNFKGGKLTHSDNGDALVLLPPRVGYVNRYLAEHRLAASRVLGRMVERGEVVLRVNRQVNDNRPENLFLCGSRSEATKRNNGSLPWPTQSNL
jgi:hypothetical protein